MLDPHIIQKRKDLEAERIRNENSGQRQPRVEISDVPPPPTDNPGSDRGSEDLPFDDITDETEIRNKFSLQLHNVLDDII